MEGGREAESHSLVLCFGTGLQSMERRRLRAPGPAKSDVKVGSLDARAWSRLFVVPARWDRIWAVSVRISDPIGRGR
jgi:hypothetical protein